MCHIVANGGFPWFVVSLKFASSLSGFYLFQGNVVCFRRYIFICEVVLNYLVTKSRVIYGSIWKNEQKCQMCRIYLCVRKWRQMVVVHGSLFRCAYDLKYEQYLINRVDIIAEANSGRYK